MRSLHSSPLSLRQRAFIDVLARQARVAGEGDDGRSGPMHGDGLVLSVSITMRNVLGPGKCLAQQQFQERVRPVCVIQATAGQVLD